MSADNYIYVRKREDGKYGVSHRFASVYYRDEIPYPPREAEWLVLNSKGWALKENEHTGPYFATSDEALATSPVREDWVDDPPSDGTTHDTVDSAVKAAYAVLAHYEVVEYGVQLSPEVQKEFTQEASNNASTSS